MEVKRYENDELHIVLKNPYCQKDHHIPTQNGIFTNRISNSVNRDYSVESNPNLSRNSSLRKATSNTGYPQFK